MAVDKGMAKPNNSGMEAKPVYETRAYYYVSHDGWRYRVPREGAVLIPSDRVVRRSKITAQTRYFRTYENEAVDEVPAAVLLLMRLEHAK